MKPIEQMSDEELLRCLGEVSALPDAPPTFIMRAINLMSEPHAVTLVDTAVAAIRRAIATLTFDSFSGGNLAYGVRGTPSDVRHLLYSALGRDIDVRVSSAAERFVLAGQVLGPDEIGTIELTHSENGGEPCTDQAAAKVPLDSMGQFRIEGIAAGIWTLRLRLGNDEIELPAIQLGEQRP